MSYRFEPHATLGLLQRGTEHCTSGTGRGGVYPGYGTWGWLGGAIPVPRPHPFQDPELDIFYKIDPTHGQMKAILMTLMRFLRYGLRYDLR